MGLCKCPRKKVTNLFCFEHRVNVCEHCLMENHSKCIVQSYLTWLQDSDYDSNCPLCGYTLSNDSVDTVRLVCLHLYHWPCLDAWARQFPAHTAPAGYTCPVCHDPVFPRQNQLSPVVDALKQRLSTTNWARAGLGLPLVPEYDIPTHPAPALLNTSNSGMSNKQNGTTVVPVDVDRIASDEFLSHSRKGVALHDVNEPLLGNRNLDMDNEDNKYKRRSAFEWLRRWLKSKSLLGHKRTVQPYSCKRIFFYILLLFIGVLTLVTVLNRLSSSHSSDDPFLDPMANPNIHVADKAAAE